MKKYIATLPFSLAACGLSYYCPHADIIYTTLEHVTEYINLLHISVTL